MTQEGLNDSKYEKLLGFIFGFIFLTISLVVVLYDLVGCDEFKKGIVKTILALAGGGCAGIFSGFINIEFKKYLRAGGGLGVFLVIFMYFPNVGKTENRKCGNESNGYDSEFIRNCNTATREFEEKYDRKEYNKNAFTTEIKQRLDFLNSYNYQEFDNYKKLTLISCKIADYGILAFIEEGKFASSENALKIGEEGFTLINELLKSNELSGSRRKSLVEEMNPYISAYYLVILLNKIKFSSSAAKYTDSDLEKIKEISQKTKDYLIQSKLDKENLFRWAIKNNLIDGV